MRIVETDDGIQQTVSDYAEQEIKMIRFNDKAKMDVYAEKYAKMPFDFYGSLCEISVILLPDHYGILAKLHHIISDAWTLALIATKINPVEKGYEK